MEKLTCKQAHVWWTFLIDNVPLTEEQHDQLKKHLKSCHRCVDLFSELNQVENAISTAMDSMVNEHINDEKLVDYIDGKIDSEVERKIIATHLQKCEVCREIFQKFSTINELEPEFVLRTKQFIIKRALKNWVVTFIQNLYSSFARPKIAIPAFASLLLLVTLLLLFQYNKGPSSLAALAEITPYPYIEVQMRGKDSAYYQLEQQGMHYYLKGEYSLAIEKLSQLMKYDSTRLVPRFYLGISYLMENQLPQAEKQLIRAAENPILKDKAYWYLAQIYLKQEEKTKAILALNKVITWGRGNLPAKAKKLIEKISQLKNE